MPRLKKVTEWNKPECRRVTEEVNKALAEVGRKLGINIQRSGNATYDNSTFRFKVECSLIGENGEVRSREAEDFKRFASIYGLEPEHFGATFKTWDGSEYTITGLNMKARKRPIIAKNIQGKSYVFPASEVKAHLESA